MCRGNSTGLRRFASAPLSVITLAISLSMVRRECGRRPGIVVSEELSTGIACQDRGPRFGAWFACLPHGWATHHAAMQDTSTRRA